MVCLLGIQGIPALAAVVLAKLYRRPIVAINQTTLPDAELKRSFWVRFAKKFVLKLSDTIVAQTTPTIDTLSRVYGIPIAEIIFAPWDGGALEFLPFIKKYQTIAKHELREQAGISPNAYVILYSGTLIGYKGVDVLIQAFANLRMKISEALLLLAGADGKPSGTLSRLQELAVSLGQQKSVRFLGRQPWDELAKLYLLSDVFVLPTRRDMWPKVLIEAALAGLPLVTTNVCGAAGYLVRKGENGFVVPVNDHVALSQALISLADNELRTTMGQASKAIVGEYVEASRFQSKGLVEAIFRAANKSKS